MTNTEKTSVAHGQLVDGLEIVAASGIPDEMTYAAREMMDERPGVADEDELAEDGPEQVLDVLEVGGPVAAPPAPRRRSAYPCRGQPPVMRCTIDITMLIIGR